VNRRTVLIPALLLLAAGCDREPAANSTVENVIACALVVERSAYMGGFFDPDIQDGTAAAVNQVANVCPADVVPEAAKFEGDAAPIEDMLRDAFRTRLSGPQIDVAVIVTNGALPASENANRGDEDKLRKVLADLGVTHLAIVGSQRPGHWSGQSQHLNDMVVHLVVARVRDGGPDAEGLDRAFDEVLATVTQAVDENLDFGTFEDLRRRDVKGRRSFAFRLAPRWIREVRQGDDKLVPRDYGNHDCSTRAAPVVTGEVERHRFTIITDPGDGIFRGSRGELRAELGIAERPACRLTLVSDETVAGPFRVDRREFHEVVATCPAVEGRTAPVRLSVCLSPAILFENLPGLAVSSFPPTEGKDGNARTGVRSLHYFSRAASGSTTSFVVRSTPAR
jgi:hypothetical protein